MILVSHTILVSYMILWSHMVLGPGSLPGPGARSYVGSSVYRAQGLKGPRRPTVRERRWPDGEASVRPREGGALRRRRRGAAKEEGAQPAPWRRAP